jgi:aryl-alcohol dehydrogenase-like predicted oxidoreductase
MMDSFIRSTLGRTGLVVHRLGLSTSYWPGKKAVYRALDEGMNLFFGFGIDRNMITVLRDGMKVKRERFIIATGAYNYVWRHQNLRKALERRLRQFRTEHIDIFMFLGIMKPGELPDSIIEELNRFKEEGKIRFTGISIHNRRYAGQLAAEGALDVLMIRYNAAHRGAEEDIFPHLQTHDPGLISYTATRWGLLLRKSRSWHLEAPRPTPGQCYRFVLSNPHVDVCLTAPRSLKQLEENIASLRQGPLSAEEMDFMKRFGDVIHHTKKWFM